MKKDRNYNIFFLLILIFSVLSINTIIAQELENYSASWVGNSFKGEPGWIPQDVEDIFVTPDGTVYTNVGWEEDRNNVVQLKNGKFIDGICPFAGDGGSNVPRHVGRTITANEEYVFYASPSDEYGETGHGITRRNRSDIDAGHLNIALDMEVTGLAANQEHLFAACKDNKIRKYDLELNQVAEWNAPEPSEMSLDKQGHLWVLSGTKKAIRFDQTGEKMPQRISFSENVQAYDIALLNDGRLIIADRGINNNLRIYKNIDSNPIFDRCFGERKGIYAGNNKGKLLPGKFINPVGVGCDSEGNIYWASGKPGQQGKSLGSAIIQSQKSDYTINWRVFSLTWIDLAAIDPTTGIDLYTKNAHFLMDWSKSDGEEQQLINLTFNNIKYPNDPRIDYQGNGHTGGPFLRILNGHKIQYNNNMYGEMFITRFEGEIGIPCGFINDQQFWYDRNGDGYREDSEIAPTELGDCMGYYVDENGDVWILNQSGKIYKFRFSGIDKNDVPKYTTENLETFSKPAESTITTFRRIVYLPEDDILLLGGGNEEHPVQHWKPMGPVVEKYEAWSKTSRKVFTKVLPYQIHDGKHETYEPFGMSIAGDYIFIVFQGKVPDHNLPRGTVGVYELKSGDLKGYMFTPESFATEHLGIMDVIWAVNAYKRSNGEYVVFIEEDGRSKVTMFRWNPDGM